MFIAKLGTRTKREWFMRVLALLAEALSKPVAALLRRYAPSLREKLQPALFSFYAWLSHNQGFTVVQPRTESAGVRPRLLIDVSTTYHLTRVSGIQRTVRSLAAALQRNGSRYGLEPVPVRLKRVRGAKLVLLAVPGFPDLGGDEHPVALRQGDCFFMLDSSWDIYPKWAVTLFPLVRALGGKIITCVYDILPITHPEFFTHSSLKMFEPWYKFAIAESDALFAISQSTRQELLRMTAGKPIYTDFFHLGADFAPAESTVAPSPAGRKVSTFLMVGTIEPRKGHKTVLQAFQSLWATGLDVRLVFVGRPGWNVSDLISQIEALSAVSDVFDYHPDASDEQLASCYLQADAVIAASLAEGFGLPLVETLLLGKPLIASDIPAFREVAGDVPIYFEPGNPASLASAVQSLLEEKGRKPQQLPRWITWDQSADQLMEKIDRFCGSPSFPPSSAKSGSLQTNQ